MQNQFADIAFPTAVRRLFTYRVPEGVDLREGVRVWVPLRKEIVIGMVVRLHSKPPDFKTRSVAAPLDESSRIGTVLLNLTEWVHRFYYCSWGEVLQAALPSGAGFLSEKVLLPKGSLPPGTDPVNRNRLAVNHQTDRLISDLGSRERGIFQTVAESGMTLSEARSRWREGRDRTALNRLIKEERLVVWEVPRRIADEQMVKEWHWSDHVDSQEVDRVLEEKGEYKWAKALSRLREVGLPALQTDLLEELRVTPYTLKRIEEEGLIVSRMKPFRNDREQRGEFEPNQIKLLSADQREVFEEILEALESNSYRSFLLHGVTGSGKTEIYIHALRRTLELGRGGMVLVPEIALTPQTVRRFHQIFGEKIAVLHSRLSERERTEEWERLRRGECRIVIGPRSAVFAPVKSVGLIVIDEEHDSSYKQFDPAPRYHARDVAVMRAVMEKAVVVMGSATPSMVALRAARAGKHRLLRLAGRPVGRLPEVKSLDLRQYRSAMRGPLTVELYEAIQHALGRQEQVILLYNRRGFASYLICEECGHIPQSPNASVSLTWHKKKNMLLCHYSGYARRVDKVCEACGSDRLTAMGSGTQQVEDGIRELFPGSRILRMDRDTTSGRDAHRQIYETFLNREADILIGTQLVSKGLDFPGVTVVGVLNAETELAFPSFRSGERTFQLLSQVSGRAGRSDAGGTVFIQTWRPDHRAIRYACHHDYDRFAAEELTERKQLAFPPFSRLVLFRFKGKEQALVGTVAALFTKLLREQTAPGAVMGPSPSVIEKMHGLWQWEATLKLQLGRGAPEIETLLESLFNAYEKRKPKGGGAVRVAVDVDAIE